jgi:hypothetical protein
MSIVVGFYICIIAALGLIVWWEYQRFRNRTAVNSSAPDTHLREGKRR